VVFRAAGALNDAGLVTLRINFRGVGQSTGEHDEGRGEVEDARTALDYLVEHYPGRPVTLAGFSFGSRVGMEVGLADERVANLISIGTPVDKYDFSFLKSCRKPILFVHGDRDEFGAAERVRTLAASLPPEAKASVHIIENADHFFEGRLDEMKRVITEWMKEQQQAGDGTGASE
jgi:alpha/beta superfamily hydrolase